MQNDLSFHADVAAAQADGQPVVALETTVLTHGLPYPDNLQVAHAMQQSIRDAGACPATLGIVAGRIRVGMDDAEIEAFAAAPRGGISKCSRRDLPVLVGLKQHGALTVAGTMMVAHAAGLQIFATGGIGGVHRGHAFDVSADLGELARTPIAVICAGAKSILDLPLTLEVLESNGVPVVGIGCENLPAFFSADSGIALPHHVPSAKEAAAILQAWQRGRPDNGLLFTVPVPAAAALDHQATEAAIQQVTHEADEAGISGAAVTPFILQRLVALTDGQSLAANKALLIQNAKVAAEIAVQAADV